MKPMIQIDDFAKIEIRIGEVVEASAPEGSKKLIRQVVDFGSEIGQRVIFSGIREWFSPEDLVGKKLPYVVNLAARPMLGEESEGMLMAVAPVDATGTRSCVLLEPTREVDKGDEVI